VVAAARRSTETFDAMQTIELILFADYNQFYLQDDDERFGDLSDGWTPEATEHMLAAGDHVLGVGTVRNMNVPVQVTVDAQLPELIPSEWDKINRTSLICDTGRIVVAGCTDYFPDARRIQVPPAHYEVLIGYRNLKSLSEDGLEGDDSYHIFLAPRRDGAQHALEQTRGMVFVELRRGVDDST
jgi:hypothetical protein